MLNAVAKITHRQLSEGEITALKEKRQSVDCLPSAIFRLSYSLSGIGEPSGNVGDVFWCLSSLPDV